MTRSTIIETMARAIYEAVDCETPWDDVVARYPATFRDARAQAAAALTTYEAHLQASGMAVVAGWQPMETAPKDGTQFLMLGDPARYGRPIWIDRWWGVNYDGEKVVTPRWEQAGHHNPPASLLGWMPLPAAALPPRSE